jgi:MurNAc alpha-1-phosphate uridylyltransferase
MDAMLLAAGLGTRLRPLTHDVPKALVPIAGVPMVERIALRLISAGADRLVINLHHLGERIRDYVEERGRWGVEVVYSEEPYQPLETGGGLLNAAPLLRRDAPFFLHNTDVLTDLPLGEMYGAHVASRADATLAVMRRQTSRWLLFDDAGLMGRVDSRRDLRIETRPLAGAAEELAFAGVHVISPSLLDRLEGSGPFSILDPYLEIAGAGGRILPFRVDRYRWIDIGKPDQLAEAEAMAREMEGAAG